MANYPIGITIQNNRYPSYKWIKHSVGNKQSLINDQVNSIIEDSEGDLWYGTNNGISLQDSKTGKWRSFLKVIKEGVSKAEAEEIKAKLEAEGAEVNLK